MNNNQLDNCLAKANKLKTACQIFPDNPEIKSLSRRLAEAAAFCQSSSQHRPLTISLIGGTGVGKSFIFSTLAGIPDLSPSSSSVRGFTRRPHIAAEEKHRSFLPFDRHEIEFVPSFIPGTVLIDTPDLDTINSDNVRLAGQSLAASDIIVFVTSPDKRSDFAIQQNILAWGSRKRWFFVMNKIDQVADAPLETVKRDFFNRIKSLGFNPDDSFVFLLSAKNPDSSEFKRFSEAISATHPVKLSRTIFEEACFRSLLHAIDSGSEISDLNQLLMKMKNFQNTLIQRLLEAHRTIFDSLQFRQITSNILMQRVYATTSGSRTLFLAPYFLLLNFFRGNNRADQLQSLLKSIFAGASGIQNQFRDESRFLQENGLTEFTNQLSTPQISDNSEKIIQQIETAALESQQSRITRLYLAAGNLLPAIILLQALYRSIASWISGVWLPSDFFIHAAFLIAGSTLPGYLLVSSYLRRFSENSIYKVNEEDCSSLVVLDEKTAALESILHDSSILAAECSSSIKKLNLELPAGVYGSSTEL